MSFTEVISDFLNIDYSSQGDMSIQRYDLPENLGKGSYQIVRLKHDAAIIIFDCLFAKNFSYCIQADNLLHIAHYEEIHDAARGSHTGQTLQSDRFLIHMGLHGNYQTHYQQGSPVKAIQILLSPDYYDTYLSEKIPDIGVELKKAVSILGRMSRIPEIAFVFHQLYDYHGSGPAAFLFYESKLNELLARLLQIVSELPDRPAHQIKQSDMEAVRGIGEYISAHTAQDTPLPFLAHMACMSPAKLKYVFKAVFHCSIRDYRLQNRVHVAKELLYHTDLSVSEISAQVGYHNSGSFASVFKKYTGFLPRDYREYARKHPYINESSR